MEDNIKISTHQKPTLGSYLVGAYLFSVPTFSYSPDLKLNFIPQWVGLIVVLYAIMDILRTKKLNIPNEIKLYGLFVLWLFFTFFLVGASNDYDSILTSVKVGLITLGCTQLIKNDQDFFNALFLYGISILFVVYLNYETLLYLRYAIRITEMDRFEGTLTNANTAAIYAISVLWVSFTFFFSEKRSFIIRAFCIAFGCTALFIIYFSGSVKGMIGIALFAVCIAWTFYEKYENSLKKRVLVSIVGLGLVAAAFCFVYYSPFFFRLERIILYKDMGSPGERVYLFKTAVEVWFGNVVSILCGIGHDNFRDYNSLRTYSHSTISEVLVSAGIFGFALYFAGFMLLLKKLYFQSKYSMGKFQFTESFSCFFFLLILLFFNAFAVLYSSRELWPLIGIIAAYSQFLGKEQIIKSEAASAKTWLCSTPIQCK
jgi:hypothetical protein